MDSGFFLLSAVTAGAASLWAVTKFLLLSRFESLWEKGKTVEQIASDSMIIALYLAKKLLGKTVRVLIKTGALVCGLVLGYPTFDAILKNYPIVVILNYLVTNLWQIIGLLSL